MLKNKFLKGFVHICLWQSTFQQNSEVIIRMVPVPDVDSAIHLNKIKLTIIY